MYCNALHPFVYYYYYYFQFWSGWGLGTTYEESTGSHNNTKLLTNKKLITGRLTNNWVEIRISAQKVLVAGTWYVTGFWTALSNVSLAR
jgi:hypothetical protein